MDNVFKKLVFENSSGKKAVISDPTIKKWWVLGRRSGFTAPDVKLISQEYVGGRTKILRSIKQPRVLKLNMIVMGESEAQKDKVFHSLIDTIMDTKNGDEGKLYITRSDGLELYTNCAYKSGLNVVEQYRNYQKFTLEFYASDWNFYTIPVIHTLELMATAPIVLADDLYLSNGFVMGFGNMVGSKLIQNDDEFNINPVYRIGGCRYSITITNVTAEKRISLTNLNMLAGDVLIIDTREQYKNVYIEHYDGTIESAIDSLDWQNIALELPIVPGANSFSVTSFGSNSDLEIQIENAYMSA